MIFDTQDFDSLSPREKKTLTDLLLRISEDIVSIKKILNVENISDDCIAEFGQAQEFFDDMYVALINDDLEDKGYTSIGSKANAYK